MCGVKQMHQKISGELMKNFGISTDLLIVMLAFSSVSGAGASERPPETIRKSHSGSVGFKGGLNFSDVDNYGGSGFFEATKSYTGIRIGSYVEFALSPSVSVRTELLFSKRGFDTDYPPRTDELGNLIETRLEHRIDLPPKF